MRKLPVLAALVVGTAGFGAFGSVQADTTPVGAEGCVAYNPSPAAPPAGNVVYGSSCNYTALRKGGYATAAQGWTVKVWTSQAAKNSGAAPIRSEGSAKGSNPCAVANFINPGNYVEVTATNGVAAAGNPFPSGAPDSTTDYCTNF